MVKQSRGTLPKEAVEHLKNWLFLHFQHPYPSEEEKAVLAEETSLTLVQVNNWFINARRRLWKPIIEKQTQKDSVSAASSSALDERVSTPSQDKQENKKITPKRKETHQEPSSNLADHHEEEGAVLKSPLLTLVDQARKKPETTYTKSLEMVDVLQLYSMDNLKERVERSEKELSHVLNRAKHFNKEKRKKKLFQRWNERDSNILSIEGMRTNKESQYKGIPTGLDYSFLVL